MAEPLGLSNTEIADIYDSMISGDRNALFKLQQMATKNPKYMQTHYHKKTASKPPTASQETSKAILSQSKIQHTPPIKEANSVPAMQSGKDLLFLNAIKRGAKMQATASRDEKHRGQPKNFRRIVNSSNQVYVSQQKDKSLFRQVKQSHQIELNLISLEKPNKKPNAYALPKVHKSKGTQQPIKVNSTHIEGEKKNVALENIDKSKITLKKEHVDFKDLINKNKKMREEFEKKNEEERQIQREIMDYHNQTKDFIQQVTNRYQVNLNNHNRYLRRRQKAESPPGGTMKESQSEKKISPFKAAMKNETERCAEIDSEIGHLRSLFANNTNKLKNLQKESESFLFVRYLDKYGLQIQEEADEEGDTVEPLVQQQESGDRNRYKYSMIRTRDKKWSLIQRTEYDAQRTHSLQESRQANTTSRTSNQPQLQDSPNKVTVNERLKNLLFS